MQTLKSRRLTVDTLNCAEARRNGTMVLYLEDDTGSVEVVLSPSDVERIMVAGIDALKKRSARY